MENMQKSLDIKIYDYAEAANPKLSDIPILSFPNKKDKLSLFDNSKKLNLDYSATSPNLLTGFINVNSSEIFSFNEYVCSSQLFYIIEGSGTLYLSSNKEFQYNDGDLISCPYYDTLCISSSETTSIYWVCDYPLLQYMGLTPSREVIPPLIYTRKLMEMYLDNICNDIDAKEKNRNGILLGNTITEEWGTKTLTHILWALLNRIPANSVQKPHRHNSVALDYCVFAEGDIYTLIGKSLNEDGSIKDPIKVYWRTGSAFTTPPGWWHSHVNNTNTPAIVLPVQDAGLYSYQRTLDIQFIK